jgi:hypothetical protein
MDDALEGKRRAEEERLRARTQELQDQTRALSRERTPYDQAAHDKLRRDLAVHREELATYRSQFGIGRNS